MIRINLLPHREQKRKDRRQQFYTLIGVVALAGLLVAILVHTFISNAIENQQARNRFLENEIAGLEKEIAEIKRLRAQIESLLARKQVIESLQTHRGEIVHFFNEMASQIPEGVYLTKVEQTGQNVLLFGYAQSNARVSMLMRNLDGSPYITNPVLKETKAAILLQDANGVWSLADERRRAAGGFTGERRVSEYTLQVSFERPKPEGAEEAAK